MNVYGSGKMLTQETPVGIPKSNLHHSLFTFKSNELCKVKKRKNKITQTQVFCRKSRSRCILKTKSELV